MNDKERIEKESWKKKVGQHKIHRNNLEKKRGYQSIKKYLTNTTIAPHEEHP